jgi:maleylacetoacetate isomerase
MKLYSFFRSSAAYRVRIALNLKGLNAEYAPINLRKGGGEQYEPAYRKLNSQSLVPALEDGGHVLTQSLAILEYLEEAHPRPALLPQAPAERARVRSLALAVACEIHPLNNTRVLAYLKDKLGADDAARDGWYRHWIATGLGALEARLSAEAGTGRFCHGDAPTFADCCLVPQLYNARRFPQMFGSAPFDLGAYSTLMRIEQACLALPAFQAAAPERQPDAV